MAINIVESSQNKLRFAIAMRLLIDVVPTLMDESISLTRRVAVAWTWLKFLCKVSRCPEDVPQNIDEWGSETIEKIAYKLVEYARELLAPAV